ncbi:uncharacterized protein LOC8261339 [Ricinus communis]|uniref:Telomeric repeat binding protein, putative n=1 Tax=Ricinus communis TaxID=3988 RepID=B9RZZ5_RICCO|nr:uncharacterized protein LOC8261339 [Ricinus communis]EEF43178.1 telomeric repeat binding protein, putative [Ricinus communis]|eukprot:XP_002519314.1 uncharacterized protein LOC8261339 [Ricinus communis]
MKKLDTDITSWIMELLVRKELHEPLVKKFLTNPHLPLDNDNLRLKKTLLLRSIDSQISDGSVSETILDSLEAIEELDRENHIIITDSMKAAYCAVAVECTVKYLWGNQHKSRSQGKYVEAVKRIWRDRIQNLEMAKKSDLVTDELRKSRQKMEAVLLDSHRYKSLKELNTRNVALLLTGDYIHEAMALMGPSFLELVARTEREAKEKEVRVQKENKENEFMAEGEMAQREKEEMEVGAERENKEKELRAEMAKEKDLRAERKKKDNEVREGMTAMEERHKELMEASTEIREKEKEGCSAQVVDCSSDAVPEFDADGLAGQEIPALANSSSTLSIADKLEIQRKMALQKHKHIAVRRRNKGQARITDSDELDLEVASSKFDTLSTPEVKRTQEMLNSSFSELQAAVDDPLPNALHVADTVIAEIERKNPTKEALVETQKGKDVDASNPSTNAVTTEMSSRNVIDVDACNPSTNAVTTEMASQNVIDVDASNLSANAVTTEMASRMTSNEPLVENLKLKDIHRHEKDATKPSLMDRNNTAHTYEWNDSIDDSSEGRINRSIRLDSPKRKDVSPLRKYEIQHFAKRRIKRRWSVEEEDALREGVQKYGRGNWKVILSSKRDIFVGRTEVDLKDKWRNMMR